MKNNGKKELPRIHTGFAGEESGYYFDVSQVLFEKQSSFQKVKVIQNRDFGRVLLLDNEVMTTEWDHFFYPEMITHPALTSHPAPKSLGIIGGGDGGVATEACRHTDLAEVIMCEIDEEVVKASREFFPKLSAGLNDERVTCVFEDGTKWLVPYQQHFDVLLVDGTDPIGPGIVLFEEAFYQQAKASLKPGGIFVQQVESPMYSRRCSDMAFELLFEDIVKRARTIFDQVHVYVVTIPSYIGCYWAFMYAGGPDLPLQPRDERWQRIAGQTQYYSPEIQQAAFTLPPFVKRLLSE